MRRNSESVNTTGDVGSKGNGSSGVLKAYCSLEDDGWEHFRINHSIQFVDPDYPFIHTQNIEGLWRLETSPFESEVCSRRLWPGKTNKVRSYAIYMLNIFFFDDFQSLPPSENSLKMFSKTPRTSSNKKTNIKTIGKVPSSKMCFFRLS